VEYRVEELSAATGASVDTIRFYQGRGLIEKPARRGRVAIYGEPHRRALQRIRELNRQGFTLAQIQKVLSAGDETMATSNAAANESEPLLGALLEQGVGARSLTRKEIAAESGLPEALIRAAEAAHLIEPMRLAGREHFSEADLGMARAAMRILEAGFPLDALLGLATDHARNVQNVAERAIDLFDDHVRKSGGGDDFTVETFRDLLPEVTRLVALHFQRTVVNRALERLEVADRNESGEGSEAGEAGQGAGESPLEQALAATRSARLEVEWR